MVDIKREFTIKKDGQEVELYIKNLSLEEIEKAESVRLRKYHQSLKDGAILAENLSKFLKEQGIWSDEKELRQRELQEELIEAIRKLKRGGIKKSEGRQLAIKIRQLKNDINFLSLDRIKYINETCEGQAQNSEFNYKVSQATVYLDNKSKKYFDSYEDYLNRAGDVDGYLCANKCAEIFYSVGDTSELEENKFLRRFKYVDENLRLIDEGGHLVDIDGKLINEAGDYVKIVEGKEIVIDEKGEQIENIDSNPKPFLDENNEPILDVITNE